MVFEKTGEKDGLTELSDGSGFVLLEFIEMTVVKNEEYHIFLQQGDDMAIILRFEENINGNDKYYTVDDDDVFDSIYDAFKAEYGDEFSFDG